MMKNWPLENDKNNYRCKKSLQTKQNKKNKQKQKTKIADTTGENIRNLFRLKKK